MTEGPRRTCLSTAYTAEPHPGLPKNADGSQIRRPEKARKALIHTLRYLSTIVMIEWAGLFVLAAFPSSQT